MIDFYDAEFSLPLDAQVYLKIPGHKRRTPPARRLNVKVECPTWMGQANALIWHDGFRLKVCPSKVLGSWNCYGSNDLRQLVALTAPLVLQQLGHRLTAEQEASITAGNYRLHELHIAESFHLVNFSQVEFIRLLFYALGEDRRPEWARRGTGFSINRQNRRVYAYVYAKLEEFLARGWPAYDKRLAQTREVSRPWAVLSRRAHLLAAALGPRLELRFGDQFFRGNELGYGRAWKPGAARRLYEQELQRLDLPEMVAPMFQRDAAKAALTAAQFQTLRLWGHGEPFESLGSAATRKRHRAAIREALDIDIKLPAGSLLDHRPVAVRSVFDMQNAVGTDFDLDDADNEELVHRVLAAR
jgi:hypothetical protein